MYILGINSGHNSTACLLKDVRIIACVSEERFKRIKNYAGYPEESIKYLLEFAGIKSQELDLVVLGNIMLPPFASAQTKGARPLIVLHWMFSRLRAIWGTVEFKLPFLRPFSEFVYDRAMDFGGPIILRREKRLISLKLAVPEAKVMAVEHHTSHAFAAYYGSRFNRQQALGFTLDGEGDKLCATVSIYHNGSYERIAATHLGHSIGWIYMDVTQLLGMKPMEHEYKVMGLAPYAKSFGTDKVYHLIADIIGLDKRNPLVFRSKFDTHRTLAYFQKI